MRNENGHTPRQIALDITINMLKTVHKDNMSVVAKVGTPHFQKKVLQEIAKLHNRLLDESKLDHHRPLEEQE